LNQSHIGRTRHIDQIDSDDPVSRRIYRQGFEFIEPLSKASENTFRVGLNFVSFQNDPSRLLFMLTDSNWLGNANFGGDIQDTASNQLLSVQATGIFFVPPKENLFPGSSLFETN
jgi:deferrochelatase/peroxidase EfeB